MEEKAVRGDMLSSEENFHCWQYLQLSALHQAQPDNAWKLGFKAKQGYVIYRIRVLCGGYRRPVPKGVTYSKPVHHGTNQLKFAGTFQSFDKERERHGGVLRVLNSYCIDEDSKYRFLEVILIDSFRKVI